MSRWLALAVAVALAITPGRMEAQDWRTISSSRMLGDEDALRVSVKYGAGEMAVEPGDQDLLYRLSLRFDADVFQPIHEYREGKLKVGVEGGGKASIRDGGRLRLVFGTSVPMDLDLSFGAAAAEMELGGMRIRSATIQTGASDAKLNFSRPNPERMNTLTVEAGAAALRARGLGNANVERITFSGGVGDVDLDFSGAWRGDTNVKVDLGLGSLTLRVPRGIGVRVDRSTFLVGFDSEGLIKRGRSYFSPDWEDAEHRLTVEVNGAFGAITIRWIEPDDVS